MKKVSHTSQVYVNYDLSDVAEDEELSGPEFTKLFVLFCLCLCSFWDIVVGKYFKEMVTFRFKSKHKHLEHLNGTVVDKRVRWMP